MSDENHWRIHQEKAAPIIKALHDGMLPQRDLVPNGSATTKALDYSLKHWSALTRPGRWGRIHRQRSGGEPDPVVGVWTLQLVVYRIASQRQTGGGAHGLIQSARMNGHDPYAYLKDVLTRLLTPRASEIG